MAVSIAILSEFADAGIKKAVAEFQQLETVGQKAQFALKKAAVPAGVALTALAGAAVSFAKAAAEDEAAAALLAGQLRRSTKATDEQIASVEKLITKTSMQVAISDDELRPAYAALVRVTQDVTRANKLLAVATDVSAATGKDLSTVTNALVKAEQGQYAALKRLGIPLTDVTQSLIEQGKFQKVVNKAQLEYQSLVDNGASDKEVAKAKERLVAAQEKLNAVTIVGADYITDLEAATKGAGIEAGQSTAKAFERFKITLDETKESIGAALLPILEKVLPVLQRFAQWAQENPKLFTAVAAAIAAVAAAIVAVNFAMALNPFTLIAAGVAALVVAVVAAYNKFEGFRDAVKNFIDAMKGFWESVLKPIVSFVSGELDKLQRKFEYVIDLINKLPAAGKGLLGNLLLPDGSRAPGGFFGRREADVSMTTGINIYVNGGDPNAVVDAIKAYNRQTGAIPGTFISV